MQDLDSLRARVDQTAEKLAVAETERRERTTSLVEMLQQLEEKYSAQEDELIHYRQRLAPLEAANGELAALMGRFLDLIDTGFETGGSGSLREAAKLAADMLGTEAPQLEDVGQTDEAALADQVLREFEDTTAAQPLDAADADASEAPIEAAPQIQAETDTQVETETETLSDIGEQPDQLVAENDEQQVLTEAEPVGQFEEVSSVVLDLETEEDAAMGKEDLPAIVQVAADIAADDGLTTVASELADDIDMSAVAEEIAAAVNAEAIAAESLAEDEDADPADDIKALLARVEALAAKAEAMRESEEGDAVAEPEELMDQPVEIKQAGSAA